MSQHILPQEMLLLQDNPVIRTECPQAMVTDAMVAMRVKNGNLAAGDVVRVQCMCHGRTELLAEAEYRVVSRTTSWVTRTPNDRDRPQSEEIVYKVMRWGDWRFVAEPEQSQEPVATLAAGPDALPSVRAVWNVAKRGYNIKIGDQVVAFEPDKDTANRIAAGELPAPEMA